MLVTVVMPDDMRNVLHVLPVTVSELIALEGSSSLNLT